jgi:hypothetical protein
MMTQRSGDQVPHILKLEASCQFHLPASTHCVGPTTSLDLAADRKLAASSGIQTPVIQAIASQTTLAHLATLHQNNLYNYTTHFEVKGENSSITICQP